MSRPFRAFVRFHPFSQGVALGWLVAGLWPCGKMKFRTGSSSALCVEMSVPALRVAAVTICSATRRSVHIFQVRNRIGLVIPHSL